MSTIIDDLVTDRSQSDVAAVQSLNVGMKRWSQEEKANYLAGMKGAYTFNDLNRVGAACAYLHSLIAGIGYTVPNYTTPKTDWVVGDIPTFKQMQTYIMNLAALKSVWGAVQTIPATMDAIDHNDANNIEKLLIEVDKQIKMISRIFIRSGAWNAFSGTGFYIAN